MCHRVDLLSLNTFKTIIEKYSKKWVSKLMKMFLKSLIKYMVINYNTFSRIVKR